MGGEKSRYPKRANEMMYVKALWELRSLQVKGIILPEDNAYDPLGCIYHSPQV